jgi:hypothetical protein
MLVIVGLSFLMMYISVPKEWQLLIPAVLILGIGVVLIMTEYGYFYQHDVFEAVRMYWPVGLILFGGAMVARRALPQAKP